MDGTRFDLWTRRQLGLATGGAMALALGLPPFPDAEARRKKKRRKKRCLRVNQPCRDGSKKKRCCKDLTCDEGQVVLSSLSCCRNYQVACEHESECCGSFKCQPAVGLPGNRCCAPEGISCQEHGDCCASMVGNAFCNNNNCVVSL